MSTVPIPRASRPPPEVVVFVDPSKRKKAKPKAAVDTSPAAEDVARSRGTKAPVISMKRARFDVHKFGISGFTKEKKEEAKVQLAVDLGAKPPKNKFYNYKELMVMKKAERSAEAERRQRDRALGLKVKKPNAAKSRGKAGPKSLNCQVGRYKDGMQIIPKRLIKKPGRR